jgi:hypothetical protein
MEPRLSTAVDLAPVTDCMDGDGALVSEELIDDSMVAHPELEETGQVAVEGFGIDLVHPIGKPSQALDDPRGHRTAELGQVLGCRVQDLDLV